MACRQRSLKNISSEQEAASEPKAAHTVQARDAPSMQSGLALFPRIGLALSRLAGSPEGLRIWMNAPNSQREGKTPLAVVLDGQGDIVSEMLEDMLIGQPA